MDSTVLLNDLITQAEQCLTENGYTVASINKYRSTWNLLKKECSKEGIKEFDLERCLTVAKVRYSIPDSGRLSDFHRSVIRHIKVLDDISSKGYISRCHQRKTLYIPDRFLSTMNMYTSYCQDKGLSKRTIIGKCIQMSHFFRHIHDCGVSELTALEPDSILEFLDVLRSRGFSGQSITGFLFTLRDFLKFGAESGLFPKEYNQLIPVIHTNKNERIPSLFTAGERKKILTLVNRNSSIGKRDYIILLLAIQLGIRAGDICRLRKGDIKWSRDTLEFKQHKTDNPIILPLPENMRLALLDYLKNARPDSQSDKIFVRFRAPHDPYVDTNTFSYVIKKYLIKADIDYTNRKHGLHSMRHSLASSLLKGNTPYPVITGILGHENSSTTRTYLSIDIEQLRSVALEV